MSALMCSTVATVSGDGVDELEKSLLWYSCVFSKREAVPPSNPKLGRNPPGATVAQGRNLEMMRC